MDAALMLEKTTLNPQQVAAASFGNEPLLIVAGAGTGKTNTLAHRVAYLIASGVNPSRILLLTFTRRAAKEMARRVENILASVERKGASPGAVVGKIWHGTFHAIANRLLRLPSSSASREAISSHTARQGCVATSPRRAAKPAG